MKTKQARLLSLMLLCTAFLSDAHADPANDWTGRGTGDYGMLSPEWPCDAAVASETNLPVLNKSILWNTFGTDTSCLERYLADKRLANLQIHLINEPCVRNRRCGPYEFLHGTTVKEYDSKLKARDPQLIAHLTEYTKAPADLLASKLGDWTTCYVSPGLESNLSMPAAQVLIDLTRSIFPKCKIVWNPAGINKGAKPIPDTHFEVHGSDVTLTAPCIANLDGEDISFPSRPALLPQFIKSDELPVGYFGKYSACDLRFLWIAEHNGLNGGPFIDPRKRGAALFPSAATFGLVAGALNPAAGSVSGPGKTAP